MAPVILPDMPSAAAHARVGFEGASLGQSLADWRAAAPAASCQAPAGRVVTCTTPPAPLGGGYLARDLTYRFVDGQLTRISFRTAVDAYDWVRTRLDDRFGRPTGVVRNDLVVESVHLPHVRDTWRNGRATMVLDDPSRDGTTFTVTYTLDALANALPAA